MKKTRILYIILLISSVLLSVGFTDPYIGLTLLYSLGIMLILSALSVLLAPFFVKTEQIITSKETTKGNMLEYTLILNNKGLFFYPHVEITYENTDILYYREGWIPNEGIKPRNIFRSKNEITFPFRGRYNVGINKIVLIDPLGLFTYVIDDIPLLSVVVYPTFEKNYVLNMEENPRGLPVSKNYLQEDYSSIEDVREYQPMDEIRHVHWQLSAQRGNLLVKNYERIETQELLLVIDTKAPPLVGKDRYHFEDSIIYQAASGAFRGIELGRKVKVLWGSKKQENMMIENEKGFLEGLEKLADVVFQGEGYQIPTKAYTRVVDHAIFYLWQISAEVLEAISELKYQSIIPMVYFFQSPNISVTEKEKQWLNELENQGIAIAYIGER